VARDIDRKLRLTAALLGTVTRKDLATIFRKANPATSFDVGRADKWLQGRAQPRQLELYDDWAKVLDIAQPGRWIADSEVDVFLREICARHGRDPAAILQRLEESGAPSSRSAPGLDLAGTYACYSHAWSPYFRGRIVRGTITIKAAASGGRLDTTYVEALPTGRMQLGGTGTLSKNDLRFDVRDLTGTTQLITFCLFPPTPPASVLSGLMLGTTLIGPDAQPSMSRVIMVRLPEPHPDPGTLDAYLPAPASIAEDLVSLGVRLHDQMAAERCLDAFLNGGSGNSDQVPVESYRALVDLFDRAWLTARYDPTPLPRGD
jgi:hypothetical protein